MDTPQRCAVTVLAPRPLVAWRPLASALNVDLGKARPSVANVAVSRTSEEGRHRLVVPARRIGAVLGARLVQAISSARVAA